MNNATVLLNNSLETRDKTRQARREWKKLQFKFVSSKMWRAALDSRLYWKLDANPVSESFSDNTREQWSEVKSCLNLLMNLYFVTMLKSDMKSLFITKSFPDAFQVYQFHAPSNVRFYDTLIDWRITNKRHIAWITEFCSMLMWHYEKNQKRSQVESKSHKNLEKPEEIYGSFYALSGATLNRTVGVNDDFA